MPRRKPAKMFRVVVLAGVGLSGGGAATACGSGSVLPSSGDGGPAPSGSVVTSNPPTPYDASAIDASDSSLAPTDASGDSMPIIK